MAPKQQALETAAGAVTEAAPEGQIAPLPLPAPVVRQYLDRFGIAAVHIICAPTGYPCMIGSGRDLADALAVARRTWPRKSEPPILVAAWWAFDARPAQQVVNLAVASDLRLARRDGQRFAITVNEATEAIQAAAGRLRFRLTDHGAVMARAKAAGIALEDKLSAAQDAGQLKGFNQEYSRRRRAGQAQGEKFMAYSLARARLRAVLAAAASGKPVGDVLKAVFES